MASRRTHRKSRMGCYQCKRRRIKCDEAPAPCGNCRKHNIIDCEFPFQSPNSYSALASTSSNRAGYTSDSPAPIAPSAKPPTSNPAHSPSNPPTGINASVNSSISLPPNPPSNPPASPSNVPEHSPRNPLAPTAAIQPPVTTAPTQLPAFSTLDQGSIRPPSPPAIVGGGRHVFFNASLDPTQDQAKNLNLDDLELLHHYTTKTYRTLSYNNEYEDIWRNTIPGEAVKHPFLMHGLLALAALHFIECSDIDDEETHRKYAALANRHQNLALVTFRPELNSINPSNCNAVFAFSNLIAALAFAFSRPDRGAASTDLVEQAIQDFYLFRGVDKVLHSQWTRIVKGKLGILVRSSSDPSSAHTLSKDVIDNLDFLHGCNGSGATHIPPAEKGIYNHAIRELRISFERSPASWDCVFRWPMVVPEAYLGLLELRKPMALVILGHYCVILSRLDMCWWSEGRSRHLFEAVFKALHPSWRQLVEWPMQMIGLSGTLANVT